MSASKRKKLKIEEDEAPKREEWDICQVCDTLSIEPYCLNPCPPCPKIVKLLQTKKNVEFFLRIAKLGGYKFIHDWESLEKEFEMNQEYYEENFLSIEKEQIQETILKLLENKKKLQVEDWQMSLVATTLYGKDDDDQQQPFCSICEANVELLVEKTKCLACKKAVICNSPCLGEKKSFCCDDCFIEDTPSLLNFTVCFNCGKSSNGVGCCKCSAMFCSNCAMVEFDNLEYICFYCKIFETTRCKSVVTTTGMPTKQIKISYFSK